MNTRFKSSFFVKAICWFTAQVFLFNSIAYGQNFTTIREKPLPIVPKLDTGEVSLNLDEFNIPENYGKVKEVFNGKGDDLVIHIQDAHVNYEAQTNIAKIIGNIAHNHGVNLACVEGSKGNIDTTLYSTFPVDSVKEEVSDYFVREGRLTGPEFLSITSGLPLELHGVEEPELYLEDKDAYLGLLPYMANLNKETERFNSLINKFVPMLFSGKQLEFFQRIMAYQDNELPMADYCRYMEKLALDLGLEIADYPSFKSLIESLDIEEKIDYTNVEKERTLLIQDIEKKLVKEELQELVKKSLLFRLGRVSTAQYYLYLRDLINEEVQLEKDYPNLARYIDLVDIYNRMNNESLFKECQKLEYALKERLYKNKEQRGLDNLSKNAHILSKLLTLKLTREEWDYYLENKDSFRYRVFKSNLDSLINKVNNIRRSKDMHSFSYNLPQELFKYLDTAERFYAIALERDKAIIENTISKMKGDKKDKAILVTGGFHTEGLLKELKERDISYVVISPRITKKQDDQDDIYISRLENRKTALEEILAKADQSLGLISVLNPIAKDPEIEKEIKSYNLKEYAIANGGVTIVKGFNLGKIIGKWIKANEENPEYKSIIENSGIKNIGGNEDAIKIGDNVYVSLLYVDGKKVFIKVILNAEGNLQTLEYLNVSEFERIIKENRIEITDPRIKNFLGYHGIIEIVDELFSKLKSGEELMDVAEDAIDKFKEAKKEGKGYIFSELYESIRNKYSEMSSCINIGLDGLMAVVFHWVWTDDARNSYITHEDIDKLPKVLKGFGMVLIEPERDKRILYQYYWLKGIDKTIDDLLGNIDKKEDEWPKDKTGRNMVFDYIYGRFIQLISSREKFPEEHKEIIERLYKYPEIVELIGVIALYTPRQKFDIGTIFERKEKEPEIYTASILFCNLRDFLEEKSQGKAHEKGKAKGPTGGGMTVIQIVTILFEKLQELIEKKERLDDEELRKVVIEGICAYYTSIVNPDIDSEFIPAIRDIGIGRSKLESRLDLEKVVSEINRIKDAINSVIRGHVNYFPEILMKQDGTVLEKNKYMKDIPRILIQYLVDKNREDAKENLENYLPDEVKSVSEQILYRLDSILGGGILGKGSLLLEIPPEGTYGDFSYEVKIDNSGVKRLIVQYSEKKKWQYELSIEKDDTIISVEYDERDIEFITRLIFNLKSGGVIIFYTDSEVTYLNGEAKNKEVEILHRPDLGISGLGLEEGDIILEDKIKQLLGGEEAKVLYKGDEKYFPVNRVYAPIDEKGEYGFNEKCILVKCLKEGGGLENVYFLTPEGEIIGPYSETRLSPAVGLGSQDYANLVPLAIWMESKEGGNVIKATGRKEWSGDMRKFKTYTVPVGYFDIKGLLKKEKPKQPDGGGVLYKRPKGESGGVGLVPIVNRLCNRLKIKKVNRYTVVKDAIKAIKADIKAGVRHTLDEFIKVVYEKRKEDKDIKDVVKDILIEWKENISRGRLSVKDIQAYWDIMLTDSEKRLLLALSSLVGRPEEFKEVLEGRNSIEELGYRLSPVKVAEFIRRWFGYEERKWKEDLAYAKKYLNINTESFNHYFGKGDRFDRYHWAGGKGLVISSLSEKKDILDEVFKVREDVDEQIVRHNLKMLKRIFKEVAEGKRHEKVYVYLDEYSKITEVPYKNSIPFGLRFEKVEAQRGPEGYSIRLQEIGDLRIPLVWGYINMETTIDEFNKWGGRNRWSWWQKGKGTKMRGEVDMEELRGSLQKASDKKRYVQPSMNEFFEMIGVDLKKAEGMFNSVKKEVALKFDFNHLKRLFEEKKIYLVISEIGKEGVAGYILPEDIGDFKKGSIVFDYWTIEELLRVIELAKEEGIKDNYRMQLLALLLHEVYEERNNIAGERVEVPTCGKKILDKENKKTTSRLDDSLYVLMQLVGLASKIQEELYPLKGVNEAVVSLSPWKEVYIFTTKEDGEKEISKTINLRGILENDVLELFKEPAMAHIDLKDSKISDIKDALISGFFSLISHAVMGKSITPDRAVVGSVLSNILKKEPYTNFGMVTAKTEVPGIKEKIDTIHVLPQAGIDKDSVIRISKIAHGSQRIENVVAEEAKKTERQGFMILDAKLINNSSNIQRKMLYEKLAGINKEERIAIDIKGKLEIGEETHLYSVIKDLLNRKQEFQNQGIQLSAENTIYLVHPDTEVPDGFVSIKMETDKDGGSYIIPAISIARGIIFYGGIKNVSDDFFKLVKALYAEVLPEEDLSNVNSLSELLNKALPSMSIKDLKNFDAIIRGIRAIAMAA